MTDFNPLDYGTPVEKEKSSFNPLDYGILDNEEEEESFLGNAVKTTTDLVKDVGDEFTKFGKRVVKAAPTIPIAAVEVPAHLATMSYGVPLTGFGEMVDLATDGKYKVAERISKALIYNPQTEGSKLVSDILFAPFSAASAVGKVRGDTLADELAKEYGADDIRTSLYPTIRKTIWDLAGIAIVGKTLSKGKGKEVKPEDKFADNSPKQKAAAIQFQKDKIAKERITIAPKPLNKLARLEETLKAEPSPEMIRREQVEKAFTELPDQADVANFPMRKTKVSKVDPAEGVVKGTEIEAFPAREIKQHENAATIVEPAGHDFLEKATERLGGKVEKAVEIPVDTAPREYGLKIIDRSIPESKKKIAEAVVTNLQKEGKSAKEAAVLFDEFLRDNQSFKGKLELEKKLKKGEDSKQVLNKKFNDLANTQRGKPESAMIKVQHKMGGGVLNPVVEHAGDLIHRMSQRPEFYKGGFEWVKEKVDTVNRYLNSEYGFEKEFKENTKNNAKYNKKDFKNFKKALDDSLSAYAKEHKKLTPYNNAQKLANDLAISIGEQRWNDARSLVSALKKVTDKGEKAWQKFALEEKISKPKSTTETQGKSGYKKEAKLKKIYDKYNRLEDDLISMQQEVLEGTELKKFRKDSKQLEVLGNEMFKLSEELGIKDLDAHFGDSPTGLKLTRKSTGKKVSVNQAIKELEAKQTAALIDEFYTQGKLGYKKGKVVPWKMEHFAEKAAVKAGEGWKVKKLGDKSFVIEKSGKKAKKKGDVKVEVAMNEPLIFKDSKGKTIRLHAPDYSFAKKLTGVDLHYDGTGVVSKNKQLKNVRYFSGIPHSPFIEEALLWIKSKAPSLWKQVKQVQVLPGGVFSGDSAGSYRHDTKVLNITYDPKHTSLRGYISTIAHELGHAFELRKKVVEGEGTFAENFGEAVLKKFDKERSKIDPKAEKKKVLYHYGKTKLTKVGYKNAQERLSADRSERGDILSMLGTHTTNFKNTKNTKQFGSVKTTIPYPKNPYEVGVERNIENLFNEVLESDKSKFSSKNNPLDVRTGTKAERAEFAQDVVDYLESKGYDGIKYKNTNDAAKPFDSWIVFGDKKVKSKTKKGESGMLKAEPAHSSFIKMSELKEATKVEKVKSSKLTGPQKVPYKGDIKKEAHEIFDLIGDKKRKRMRTFNVVEHIVEPGESIRIPATWHDAVFRRTFTRDPKGNLVEGRGGSYDTILMEGNVAGAKEGKLPPGSVLYVLDIGGEGSVAQTRSLRIYRAKSEAVKFPKKETLKLLTDPLKGEEGYIEIDIASTVKIIRDLGKDIKRVLPHLENLGRHFYEGAKQRYFDWQKKMKSSLGDLWEGVKGQIEKVWKRLKSGKIKTETKPFSAEHTAKDDFKPFELNGEVQVNIGKEANRFIKIGLRDAERFASLTTKGSKAGAFAPTDFMFDKYPEVRNILDQAREIDATIDSRMKTLGLVLKTIEKKYSSKKKRKQVGINWHMKNKLGKEAMDRLGHKETKNAEYSKIQEELQPILTELVTEVNKIRAKLGKKPITLDKDYLTFFAVENFMTDFMSLTKGKEVNNIVLDDIQSIKARHGVSITESTAFPHIKREGLREGIKLELDPLVIVNRYAREALNHIHKSPLIAFTKEALKSDLYDPKTGKKLSIGGNEKTKASNPHAAAAIGSWINKYAGKSNLNLPRRLERTGQKIMDNLTTAQLLGSLRTAIVQSAALGPTAWKHGYLNTMSGIIDTAMRGKSIPYKESKVLPTASWDVAASNASNAIGASKFKKGTHVTKEVAAFLMKAIDYLAREATFRTVYKTLEPLVKKGKLSKKDAIRMADSEVIRTQGSGSTTEISPIQRNVIGKMATLWQTHTINQANFFVRDVLGAGGKTIGKVERSKRIIRTMFGIAAFGVLYEQVFGIQSPFPAPVQSVAKDIKNDAHAVRMMRTVLLELSEGLPFGGSVKFGSSILGPIADHAQDIVKVLSGKGDFNQDLLDSAINGSPEVKLKAKIKILELIGKSVGIAGTAQFVKYARGRLRGEGHLRAAAGRIFDKNDSGSSKPTGPSRHKVSRNAIKASRTKVSRKTVRR